jgi:hypothetical protein
MNKKRAIVLIVLGLLLISACSGSDQDGSVTTTTGQAAATSTTVSGLRLSAEPLPPPELDAGLTGDDLFVAIEARWMCDVQRFAFSDLGVMNQALEERLTPHGLSRSEYDTFKAELETQIDLREQVLAEYDAYCGED